MNEEQSKPAEELSGISVEGCTYEVTSMTNEIEIMQNELNILRLQIFYLQREEESLLSFAEQIISEDSPIVEETLVEPFSIEVSSESEKSDSEYEVVDDVGSAYTLTDSQQDYSIPNTRRSKPHRSIVEKKPPLILTRSKAKKAEGSNEDKSNASVVSKEVTEGQPDAVIDSVKLLCSLRKSSHADGAEAPSASSTVSSESPNIQAVDVKVDTKTSVDSFSQPERSSTAPVIPSALPLLSQNPATGKPPNVIDINKTGLPSVSLSMKRPFSDMSYLIPPVIAPDESGLLPSDMNVMGPNAALTQNMSNQIQSRVQTSSVVPPSQQPSQQIGNKQISSSVSRSMIQNVFYSPTGLPIPNEPYAIGKNMRSPSTQQNMNMPIYSTKQPSMNMPMKKQGYNQMSDMRYDMQPNMMQISQGYDTYNQHIGMIPMGSNPYTVQQMNRVMPNRQIPMVGNVNNQMQGYLQGMPQGMYPMMQPNGMYTMIPQDMNQGPEMGMPLGSIYPTNGMYFGGMQPMSSAMVNNQQDIKMGNQGMNAKLQKLDQTGGNQQAGLRAGMVANNLAQPPQFRNGGANRVMPGTPDQGSDGTAGGQNGQYMIPGIATDKKGNILPNGR